MSRFRHHLGCISSNHGDNALYIVSRRMGRLMQYAIPAIPPTPCLVVSSTFSRSTRIRFWPQLSNILIELAGHLTWLSTYCKLTIKEDRLVRFIDSGRIDLRGGPDRFFVCVPPSRNWKHCTQRSVIGSPWFAGCRPSHPISKLVLNSHFLVFQD